MKRRVWLEIVRVTKEQPAFALGRGDRVIHVQWNPGATAGLVFIQRRGKTPQSGRDHG